MDIVLLAQYFGNPEALEKNNNRFCYMASLLAQHHSVEVLTTSFFHKEKRKIENIPKEYNHFKITALDEPGYRKNVSLKRFFSHKVLARKMRAYLEKREKPDVIYCAVPSLDCAYAAARYAKKQHIPFIIDIQDLWPEAFKMVLKVPVLKDIVFMPMNKKANYIYSCADHIIGVSDTYCQRAKRVNARAEAISILIGTKLATFDAHVEKHRVHRDDGKLVLGYCGTLGHSYDLRCVFDALQTVRDRGYDNIEFWVMGSGPLSDVFKEYAEERNLDVTFRGWLPYEQMCGVLSSCDICISPISKGAAQSIINKHADYAASGLPIISTQECAEYQALLNDYHCGINCSCGDAQSVADAIMYLADHEEERKQMGLNARKLAETRFDRNKTYMQVKDIIERSVL